MRRSDTSLAAFILVGLFLFIATLAGCTSPQERLAAKEVEAKRQEIICNAIVRTLETALHAQAELKAAELKNEAQAQANLHTCYAEQLGLCPPRGPVSISPGIIADVNPEPELIQRREEFWGIVKFAAWVFGAWAFGFLVCGFSVLRAWWNDGWTPLMTLVNHNNERTIPDCFWIAFWWPFYLVPIAVMYPIQVVFEMRERNVIRLLEKRRLAEEGVKPIEELYQEINVMMEKEGVKDVGEASQGRQ